MLGMGGSPLPEGSADALDVVLALLELMLEALAEGAVALGVLSLAEAVEEALTGALVAIAGAEVAATGALVAATGAELIEGVGAAVVACGEDDAATEVAVATGPGFS
jgi:hypothetical protein